MRPHERRSLPPLAFALLDEERLVRRDALVERRALRLAPVHDVEARGSTEARRRLTEGGHELLDEERAAERDARGEPHELAVPERDLILGEAHLLARGTEQRVPLLEDALKLARLAAVRALDLRQHRVEVSPSRAGRGPEELDVLWEERNDAELAGDVVGAFARAVQEIAARPAPL